MSVGLCSAIKYDVEIINYFWFLEDSSSYFLVLKISRQ